MPWNSEQGATVTAAKVFLFMFSSQYLLSSSSRCCAKGHMCLFSVNPRASIAALGFKGEAHGSENPRDFFQASS